MNIKVRNLVFTGLCIALGLVLPFAFHGIAGAGGIFLPMHIPVLLCGLVVGWPYGLICGIITPFVSHVLTGMPPSPVLPGMLIELAIYGLVGGLLIQSLRNKGVIGIYLALIGAMLAGRLAAGVVNGLIFYAGNYSLQIWVTASFVKALPGIALQLVAIPAVVLALRKAGIVASPAK